MFQTVIFDLDGTLLDTSEDLTAAGNHVCRENGWPEYEVSEFMSLVGHGIPNLVSRFSPPDAQSPERLAESLRQFSAWYGAHSMDKTHPYPGIENMLSRLRADGVQMAVYSNKADDFSKALIEHFFPGCFALIQGKRDGIPVKPDPTGLRVILDQLQADPGKTLFAGDSSVDIRTGQNAGIKTCGVSWGFRSRASLEEAGADHIADRAEDLESIIRQFHFHN